MDQLAPRARLLSLIGLDTRLRPNHISNESGFAGRKLLKPLHDACVRRIVLRTQFKGLEQASTCRWKCSTDDSLVKIASIWLARFSSASTAITNPRLDRTSATAAAIAEDACTIASLLRSPEAVRAAAPNASAQVSDAKLIAPHRSAA